MIRYVTASASYRANSEDRSLVLSTEGAWFACIADGTSGMPGGGRAADVFIASLHRTLVQPDFDVADPMAWSNQLADIDAEIDRDPMAGETTGIALAISRHRIAGASCGDSRAYLLSPDGPHELTGEQNRKPRLGTGLAKPRAFSSQTRGILVIGTDGLFDYANLKDIFGAVHSRSNEAANALINLVRSAHRILPDDISVVVAWLDDA